jgi:hypothetical protein
MFMHFLGTEQKDLGSGVKDAVVNTCSGSCTLCQQRCCCERSRPEVAHASFEDLPAGLADQSILEVIIDDSPGEVEATLRLDSQPPVDEDLDALLHLRETGLKKRNHAQM